VSDTDTAELAQAWDDLMANTTCSKCSKTATCSHDDIDDLFFCDNHAPLHRLDEVSPIRNHVKDQELWCAVSERAFWRHVLIEENTWRLDVMSRRRRHRRAVAV